MSFDVGPSNYTLNVSDVTETRGDLTPVFRVPPFPSCADGTCASASETIRGDPTALHPE